MKIFYLRKTTNFCVCVLFVLFSFAAKSQNKAPVAVIKGSTVSGFLVSPVSSTILYGTSSYDPDGKIRSYKWQKVSGPSQYRMSGADEPVLNFGSLVPGKYVLNLIVTDDKGATASSSVTVKVYGNWNDANNDNGSNSGGNTGGGTGGNTGGGTGGNTGGGTGGSTDGGGTTQRDCGCTMYLEADGVGQVNADGARMKAAPGDVICIKAGKYKSMKIWNFHGTSTQPITFKNCGGPVTIAGYSAFGVAMSSCDYVRFTGSGSSDKYGISISSNVGDPYVAIGFAGGYKTSNLEVDHIEVSRASAGVWFKTQVSCDPTTWGGNYVMKDISFHDIYVHDTKGEGFYLGHTAPSVTINCNGSVKTIIPQEIQNLKVYNCITNNTGWDGIQVAAVTENCLVYNNKVTNFGTSDAVSQQYGILFGGRCNGEIYNNIVQNGTGAGIEAFARYNLKIYNNVISDVGFDGSFYGQDGIFIDDRSQPGTPPLVVKVANNTINHTGRDGIRFLNSYKNKSTQNEFYNNLVTNPRTFGAYIIYGVGLDLLRAAVDIVDKTMLFKSSNNIVYKSATDAKFVDYTSGNYKLTSSSPAVNKGKDMSSWNITKDINNVARPQGGAYDIGAYELDGTASRTASNNATTGTLAGITDDELPTPKEMVLSPVPARDYVNVSINTADDEILSLKVTDAAGKIVITKNSLNKSGKSWQNRLDVSALPQGMYYVEAVSATKKYTNKFVVIK